jgi:hypothetical protein
MMRAAATLALVVSSPGCERPAAEAVADAASAVASPEDARGVSNVLEAAASASPAIASTTVTVSGTPPLASAPAARKRAGAKGAGSPCVQGTAGACAPGFTCCETGFRGHCGGAYMPDQPQEPCVVTSTCGIGPCKPMEFPP